MFDIIRGKSGNVATSLTLKWYNKRCHLSLTYCVNEGCISGRHNVSCKSTKINKYLCEKQFIAFLTISVCWANAYKSYMFIFSIMNDVLYVDLVNVSACIMRNNATTSNTYPACSNKGSGIPSGSNEPHEGNVILVHSYRQSGAFAEITKVHRKAGTKNRKVGHGDIITGFLHESQLEARKAVTPETSGRSVPETYQARTKKPKYKRSSTNSCTKPQGTRFVKRLVNNGSDDVIGTAEIRCRIVGTTCHPY